MTDKKPQNCGTGYCSCIECPYDECVQDKGQCNNGCLMNKTTKALKLAEEAFEALVHTPIAGYIWTGKCNPALFAIREALAEQAEQEPVAILDGADEYGPMLTWRKHWLELPIGTSLYAAPAQPVKHSEQYLEHELNMKFAEGYKIGRASCKHDERMNGLGILPVKQEPVAWWEFNEDIGAWFLAYTFNPKAKTRPLVFGDTAIQTVKEQK